MTSTTAGTNQNLVNNAFYYTFIPGEYCTSASLTSCTAQTGPTTSNPYPAKLRWCSSAALTDCKASRIEDTVNSKTYKIARYPGKEITAPKGATVVITVTSATTTSSVSSIKVGATEILDSTAAASSNCKNSGGSSCVRSLASALKTKITLAGFEAEVTTNTVTITAPASLGAFTGTPIVTSSSGTTITTPAFSGGVTGVYVPGSNVLTTISTATQSYPYPGTAAKASTRTDCSGTTCSYDEEMTNYANWWAYYRTRMQMAKSAVSLAFSVLDDGYRIGFMGINSSDSNFLNIADNRSGSGGQREEWYSILGKALPSGGTPLRVALGNAGRYYAGTSTSINGVNTTDPMQYACQRNYTILSTDGYWNGDAGTTVSGGSIGDQDQGEARPYFDGGSKSGSISDTLADVAAYYYKTDIRNSTFKNANGALGTDVADDNVADGQQRMYTSTVGLGASGYMQYQSNYATAKSGDYYDVLSGTSTSSTTLSNGVCSWQSTGKCNWPTPAANGQTTIDDLWHAAVNGRGQYYSAGNPSALKSGLNSFLQGVSASTGNAAAATTSNPNTTTGDNYVFQSTFQSVDWYGELARYEIDLDTGKQKANAGWSQSGTVYSDAVKKTKATPLLDNRSYTTRSIYTYDPTDANSSLLPFAWDSMNSTMQSLFKVANMGSLTQMCASGTTCLSAAAQVNSTTAGTTTGAGGINLVNFLRGDRSNEGSDTTTYYRQRAHVMGDVVDSQAVYVKTPMYNYSDSGYAAYKTAQASRQGVVYVGANDGMLHAFNSDDGSEMWGYIPSIVLPNLYKLADKNYGASTKHTYFVNATPQQSDAYFDDEWHTILVGGLGRGGRGFYALDVTTPSTPKVLWEFTSDTSKGSGYIKDADLGYSYGTPIITKLSDGTWVVIVTSGYLDSDSTGASGEGFVWVLNAKTGAIIKKIGTGVGTSASPAGLTRLIGFADSAATNNQATFLFGGDLLGNVWKIDISALKKASGSASVQLMATLKDATGKIQPITARPQVTKIGTKKIVYVGTGQYLGLSDIRTTDTQSLYAIRDTDTSFGNPRANTCAKSATAQTNCFMKQTYSDSKGVRTASSSVSYDMDFEKMYGWYADLPVSGERANTDLALQLGTLVITTNIPSTASACSPGGSSFLMYVNYKTGMQVPGASSVGEMLSNNGTSAMASAPTLIRLPNGKVVAIINLSDGTTITKEIPVSATNQGTRRLSWRELITGQ